jgi:hypothetical protein
MTTGLAVWKTSFRPSRISSVSFGELGAAMVDGGEVHRPQDAVGTLVGPESAGSVGRRVGVEWTCVLCIQIKLRALRATG